MTVPPDFADWQNLEQIASVSSAMANPQAGGGQVTIVNVSAGQAIKLWAVTCWLYNNTTTGGVNCQVECNAGTYVLVGAPQAPSGGQTSDSVTAFYGGIVLPRGNPLLARVNGGSAGSAQAFVAAIYTVV